MTAPCEWALEIAGDAEWFANELLPGLAEQESEYGLLKEQTPVSLCDPLPEVLPEAMIEALQSLDILDGVDTDRCIPFEYDLSLSILSDSSLGGGVEDDADDGVDGGIDDDVDDGVDKREGEVKEGAGEPKEEVEEVKELVKEDVEEELVLCGQWSGLNDLGLPLVADAAHFKVSTASVPPTPPCSPSPPPSPAPAPAALSAEDPPMFISLSILPPPRPPTPPPPPPSPEFYLPPIYLMITPPVTPPTTLTTIPPPTVGWQSLQDAPLTPESMGDPYDSDTSCSDSLCSSSSNSSSSSSSNNNNNNNSSNNSSSSSSSSSRNARRRPGVRPAVSVVRTYPASSAKKEAAAAAAATAANTGRPQSAAKRGYDHEYIPLASPPKRRKGVYTRTGWCEQCQKYVIRLDKHMLTKAHDNLKMHKCSVCGYEAAQSEHLKRHLQKHPETFNPSRSYQCPYEGCDRTLSRKDKLKEHLKNAHSPEKEKQRKELADLE